MNLSIAGETNRRGHPLGHLEPLATILLLFLKQYVLHMAL